MFQDEIIIRDTHRGLWYEDGKLTRILEAGRYELPKPRGWWSSARVPDVHIELVDMREKDFTIKGQEILTADKVAIRVSILVRYRVLDPKAAMHEVESFYDRLYSDVQLAARRALASMQLEEILTNRNRLSEEILTDVKQPAEGYGVAILRADVKDLIFPGNLQDVMNRVLTAERLSEAQLVEARTKAEVNSIEAATRADAQQRDAEAEARAIRLQAEAEADALRLKKQAELEALQQQEKVAAVLDQHPVLLRLRELEAMHELAARANARIYIGFDKHVTPADDE